jgi:hypothetical protein
MDAILQRTVHLFDMAHLLDLEAGGSDSDSYDGLFRSSSEEEDEADKAFIASDDSEDDHVSRRLSHQRLRNRQIREDDDENDENDENNEDAMQTATQQPDRHEPTVFQKRCLGKLSLPGFEQYPVTDWSLTVTKNGCDIDGNYIDCIYLFFEQYCIKGGVSTEVGKRARHQHLQGIFRTKFVNDSKAMGGFIKGFLPDNGTHHRVLAKPLNRGQDFVTMCGYILKDEGQSWFRHRSFNIPREDLQTGRLQHLSALTSIDENRMVLTQRNLFAEMYKFSMRCLFPCVTPPPYVLLYMMQSGNYIPSPEWLKRYSKIETDEAQALWDIVFRAKHTTIADIKRIFFDGRSSRCRYYMANTKQGCHIPDRPATLTPTTDTESSTPESPTPYQRIRTVLNEAAPRARSQGSNMTDDLTPLPEEDRLNDAQAWVIDREGTSLPDDNDDLICPPTLDEMLLIVRSMRSDRLGYIQSEQQYAASTYVASHASRRRTSMAATTTDDDEDEFPCVNLANLPGF